MQRGGAGRGFSKREATVSARDFGACLFALFGNEGPVVGRLGGWSSIQRTENIGPGADTIFVLVPKRRAMLRLASQADIHSDTKVRSGSAGSVFQSC